MINKTKRIVQNPIFNKFTQEDEGVIDEGFRPKLFNEFLGQEKIKENHPDSTQNVSCSVVFS